MSATTAVTELVATLSAIVAPHGFDVTVVDASALSGDDVLITMNIEADGQVVGVAAVRDDLGETGEAVLGPMAEVMASGDRSTSVGEPVAGVAALIDRLDAPAGEAVAVTDGDNVVGVVILADDRRAGADAANASEPEPAPVASFPAMGSGGPARSGAGHGLDMLRRVELDVSVELGRTRMTLDEVMGFDIGSVVELDRPVGSLVDIRVNGTMLARGEVVVVDDEYAIRVTEIVDNDATD